MDPQIALRALARSGVGAAGSAQPAPAGPDPDRLRQLQLDAVAKHGQGVGLVRQTIEQAQNDKHMLDDTIQNDANAKVQHALGSMRARSDMARAQTIQRLINDQLTLAAFARLDNPYAQRPHGQVPEKHGAYHLGLK